MCPCLATLKKGHTFTQTAGKQGRWTQSQMNQTLSDEIIKNVAKKQDNSFDVSWVGAAKCHKIIVFFFYERNVT